VPDRSPWTAPVILLLDLVELSDCVTTHYDPLHVDVSHPSPSVTQRA
jgi:hypothetical protein